jgi:SAM-dependent methyltransferase
MKNLFRRAARGQPRDTDRDWAMIGEREPYFGVLTHPRFKRENLNDEHIADFFASGHGDIARALGRMRAAFGSFDPRSALDFGCGVGRLTRALAAQTGDAVGVDISPGMLAEARRYKGTDAIFVESIPERQFDWVMSIIVLQHIPPERGYAIVNTLLGAIAPGGGITLQITFARAPQHDHSVGGRLIIGPNNAWPATPPRAAPAMPEGVMLMHDYNLSRIVALFFVHGLRQLYLEETDHGGLIGVEINARKPPAA